MAWTSIQGDAALPQISNHRLINPSALGSATRRAVQSTVLSADQQVLALIGKPKKLNLFARYDSSLNIGYALEYDPVALTLTLQRVGGSGSFTNLASGSVGRPLVGFPDAFIPPSGSTINVLTSYGTSDANIRAAVAAAQSSGQNVYLPTANYTLNGNLTLNGIVMYGDGEGTVINQVSRTNSAIILSGNGAKLLNLRLVGTNYQGSRLSTQQSSAVLISGGTNWVVDRVHVNGAASVGIFNSAGKGTLSAYSQITNCLVENTLADGIHNTLGAQYVEIAYNTVTNTGDDLISCVSYTSDSVDVDHVWAHDNIVGPQTFGRGMTVVGGTNITYENNWINGTYGAGILVATESAIPTRSVANVTLNGNYTRNVCQSIHNANILVTSDVSGESITGVVGSGNNGDSAHPAVVVQHTTGTESGNTVSGTQGLTVAGTPTFTGDTISLRAVGSSISALRNGILIASVTDSIYNQTGKCGVGIWPQGAIDNFEADSVVLSRLNNPSGRIAGRGGGGL